MTWSGRCCSMDTKHGCSRESFKTAWIQLKSGSFEGCRKSGICPQTSVEEGTNSWTFSRVMRKRNKNIIEKFASKLAERAAKIHIGWQITWKRTLFKLIWYITNVNIPLTAYLKSTAIVLLSFKGFSYLIFWWKFVTGRIMQEKCDIFTYCIKTKRQP